MGKTFWTVIISFWVFCVIAGTITYSYIVHEQQEQRELFVSQYDYDAEILEDETNLPTIEGTYPLHKFSKDEFLKVANEAYTYHSNAFTQYQNLITNNKQDDAQKEAINYYSNAKSYMNLFGHNEFTDVSEREQLFLEKLAYHLHYYSKYSSLYFVIGAKKLNRATETLNNQHLAAYENMVEAKKAYEAIFKKYKEVFQ